MQIVLKLVGSLLAAMALAACSSSGAPSDAGSEASSVPVPADAEGVVQGLAAAGEPAELTVVYTASNDPNQQLGRPGGYTSKAAFTDSRIKSDQVRDPNEGSVDLGGGVEYFEDQQQALDRGTYIQTALQAAQILGTEYDYVAGPALLRVSGVLTPDQADSYRQSLSQLMGTDAVLVEATPSG